MGNQVASYARTRQLQIVGYYQAPERLGDTTLSPVGERVACKIKEYFDKPVALVVSIKRFRYLSLPPLTLSVARPTDQRFQAGRRERRGACRTSSRRYSTAAPT